VYILSINISLLKKYIEILVEEQSNDATGGLVYGDLKAFLKGDIRKRTGKKWLKAAAKIASGGAVGSLLPLGDFAESTIETIGGEIGKKLKKFKPQKILALLYGVDGSGGLETFRVNPNVSKIIDNKVEEKFIMWLEKDINNKNDNESLEDFNITDKLNEWLKGEFDSYEVKK
jgi:hypothetical protein